MNNKKYLAQVGTLALVLAVSFSGCGRASSDKISEDFENEVTDEQGGTDQTGSDETASSIPNHVINSYESVSGGGTFTVDADVLSEGIDNLHVYSLSEKTFEYDDIINIADDLFDGGSYDSVKAYSEMDKSELEEEKELYGAISGNADDDKWQDELNAIQHYIDNYESDAASDMAYAGPKYKIRGDIDGSKWELVCKEKRVTEDSSEASIITSDCNMIYVYSIEQGRCQTGRVSMDSSIKNVSDLDTCSKEADAFVSRLGYDNMAVITTMQTYGSDGDKGTLNGYEFIYGYEIDGIDAIISSESVNQNSYIQISYNGEGSGKKYAPQGYIRVMADSEGVTCAEINIGLELGDEISDDTTYISFDAAYNVAAEYINKLNDGEEQNGIFYGSKDNTITNICLRYINVVYDNNEYAMVPAWIFYGKPSAYDGMFTAPFLGVTAIDGSPFAIYEDILTLDAIDYIQ